MKSLLSRNAILAIAVVASGCLTGQVTTQPSAGSDAGLNQGDAASRLDANSDGDGEGPDWEAENAFSLGVHRVDDEAASAGAKVRGLANVGDFIELRNVPSASNLAIRYAQASDFPKQLSLYVDGEDVATILFVNTGSWSTYDRAILPTPVAGSVRLQVDADDLAANQGEEAPDIDLISAPYPGPDGETHRVGSAAEIEAAMEIAQPGDTLVMDDGDWRDEKILFAGNGAPERPITLRAETPGQVVLRGHSRLEIRGSYLVADGLLFTDGTLDDESKGHVVKFDDDSTHHCRLTNSAIIDYNPDDADSRYFWISLQGRYNRVDHNHVSGQNHSGHMVKVWHDGNPNHHLIDHNYIGKQRAENETLQIGNSDNSLQDSNTTVTYNYFEDNRGEHEMICNKSGGNVYRYNTLVDNIGHISIRHGNGARIEGNFILGYGADDMGGVRVIGEDHVIVNNYFAGIGNNPVIILRNGVEDSALTGYFQVKRAIVAFNTMVDCRQCIEVGYHKNDDDVLAPEDCLIANNIVVGDEGPLIDYVDDPINLAYSGNIMYGASLGIDPPDGVTITDPELAESDSGLFRLSAGSPAVDSAAAVDIPDYELISGIFGSARADGKPDIGAQELTSAGAELRPLTPAAVGPAWLDAP